jgi:hypothetical protein
MAYSALVKARHESSEECEKKLKAAREESEAVAEELHRLRMEK